MDYIPRVHSELAIAYDDDVIHSNSRNIHKGQQLKLLKNSAKNSANWQSKEMQTGFGGGWMPGVYDWPEKHKT